MAGALLFAVAFPNPLVRFGLWPVAFVALVPYFLAVREMRWWQTPLWGALYGFIAYALFNYWLGNFHPLAIFIVPTIYATYFAFITPLMWFVDRHAGRFRVVVQMFIWLAYEWLRTLGFLGYAYGIMGYTLWKRPALIQLASVTGVWGVSLFVVAPSVIIAHALLTRRSGGWARAWAHVRGVTLGAPGALWSVALVAVGVTAVVTPVDYSQARTWKVALIQQNVDPWVGGFRTYERSLEILTRVSDDAIEAEDPDIVVWSETSFVPSIDYHTRYRTDLERYELVRELRHYLEARDVPFVIGNSDGQLVRNASGDLERVDYNAVLAFDAGGERVGTYRKIHLVPFTEHFPYRGALTWLYEILVANDTTFWEHGTEWTIFEIDGVRFATPICFEDTFGYLSREFVLRGAEVIVNLTNDLWSYSESSAMQHLGMAVFRAVENRRSMVRSTNGGMTAIIDPNGRILEMYPPFVEGYLAGDVPVFTDAETLYTRVGDRFAHLFTAAALVALVATAVAAVVARLRRRRASATVD